MMRYIGSVVKVETALADINQIIYFLIDTSAMNFSYTLIQDLADRFDAGLS